ncbi:MAG: branched-chain amino acid ABC transporter permease [Deltaproteobacteria bacterium]|nr:branched-chain amino acid ABC transporter permease [Deltaproteobacteria bacterium]MBW2071878.1 branched-chain amino acid ABC transporter permease [Deltaproteobacteria bacterium]
MTWQHHTRRRGFFSRLYQDSGLSGPILVFLGLGFLFVPLLPGDFPTIVGVEILILGLFALSFNLIYGYMGQISFGHAAFFGLGAYATALFFRASQMTTGEIGYAQFFLSLLLAIPVSAIGALIVGFFCVRLTGIYFALLSLAFGELLFYIVFSWYGFTGGDNGIQGLLPPPFFRNPDNYYYFTLAIVAIAGVLLWRIANSPFGYTLRMLRDNQRRAAFLGINVRLAMLMNFVLAGTFAGIAGALWGPFQRSVAPGLLGWMESGIPVFMTLIGGADFFAGPLVGSVVYTALNSYVTHYTVYWPLTIGLIILVIVLFFPGGILSIIDARIRASRGHQQAREDLPVTSSEETGSRP